MGAGWMTAAQGNTTAARSLCGIFSWTIRKGSGLDNWSKRARWVGEGSFLRQSLDTVNWEILMKPRVIAVLTSLALVCVLCSQTVEDRRVAPIVAHKQIALVIGNGVFNRRLTNPLSDAQAMSQRLRELNFDVTLVTNADRKSMGKAIDQFVDKLVTGDVAFFYYSGHGMQVDGENYLIPVDFQGQNETDVRYDAHSESRIEDRMEKSGAQLNILVLDACRDNPFHSASRGGGGGLAAMSAGEGTFIAFATAPGHTASDNPNGKNGLFTQYLLEALSVPGLGLNDVFDLVREKVHSASAGREQVPWMLSSVIGRYSFLSGPSVNRVRTNEPSAPIDLEAWQAVKDSGDVDLLKQFITQYPQSPYVGVAKLKIAALSKSPPVPAPNASSPSDSNVNQSAKAGQIRTNVKDGQPYVWIPPGLSDRLFTGRLQCWPNENPSHDVTIPRGFWMGQTPVTQAAYSRVMGMNPSTHPGDKLPVERVTWAEAKRYCEASGGRSARRRPNGIRGTSRKYGASVRKSG